MDVDGSYRNGQTTCGGVIRDHQRNWICGFQQKLGYTTSIAAEIHAIYKGLILCNQLGFKKVTLHTDSLDAIHLLLFDCGYGHPIREEIQEVRSLIISHEDLQIIHTYKEALRCVDYLSRSAQGRNQDFIIISSQPIKCVDLDNFECGRMSGHQEM